MEAQNKVCTFEYWLYLNFLCHFFKHCLPRNLRGPIQMPKSLSLKSSLKSSLLKEDFRIGEKVCKEVFKEANLVM